jgi:hypothetical protein
MERGFLLKFYNPSVHVEKNYGALKPSQLADVFCTYQFPLRRSSSLGTWLYQHLQDRSKVPADVNEWLHMYTKQKGDQHQIHHCVLLAFLPILFFEFLTRIN